MKAEIKKSKIAGEVFAPTSKSTAHRLIICAALSKGKSKISGVTYCEDIRATLDCINVIGAKTEIDGDCVTIASQGGVDITEKKDFYCRESGSTLRFLLPLLLLNDKKQTLHGKGRLLSRPLTVYENICEENGLLFEQGETVAVKGRLSSGEFTVPGNISSQFVSGLLFALPLCEKDSIIHILPPIESRSYIDMTISAMNSFGVNVFWKDGETLYIKGCQSYKARNMTVEGDYSGAAFLEAFNLLSGDVKVRGLFENSLQGDKIYREYFKKLSSGTPTLDISDCPDLAPILMTLAAAKNGAALVGTKRLKIKESDRGAVMAAELSKFGAKIAVYENEIKVAKTELHTPCEPLSGHNDHRVVMSLAVLCTVYSGTITEAEAVRKSFPDFFSKIKALGAEVKIYDD